MTTDALVEVSIPRPMLPAVNAANEALALAEVLVVDSQQTLDLASAEYNSARESYEAIENLRMSLKRPILEAGRRIDDFVRPALETRQRIIEIYSRKMAQYLHEQDRLAQQEQARVREAERAERERIAREAEERERKGLEEAKRLREASEQAMQAGNQSAAGQLLSEADRAELAGVQDAHEQLALIETVHVAPTVVEPQLHGITRPRARYSAEVVNLDDLIKAVYEGRAPKAYLQPNHEVLDKTAAALQHEFKVDGCKLKVDYTVHRSSKGRKPKQTGGTE